MGTVGQVHDFRVVGATDIGRTKSINQDGYLAKVAHCSCGPVALVAVADGMGGLSKGELASATALRALSTWFDDALPQALQVFGGPSVGFERFVDGQWDGLVQKLNLDLLAYGLRENLRIGTTLSVFMAVNNRYSVVHIGDSRLYAVYDDEVALMTEDHTFIKREMDAGRMTAEEAAVHPQRNALIQCIGASTEVEPDFHHGYVDPDATYLLCSDGFRHVLSDEELREAFCPQALRSLNSGSASDRSAPLTPSAVLKARIDTVKRRGERDNITAVLLMQDEGEHNDAG